MTEQRDKEGGKMSELRWQKGVLVAAWVILLVFGVLDIIGVIGHVPLLTMLGTMILIVGLVISKHHYS